MAELFNVVFSGEVSGRADPAVVRANVARLFNASEAVLDRLFSGQPVAVKKMVDRATAMKLRALMKQAGAETRMVQVDEQGRPLAAAPAAAVPPGAAAAAPAPAANPVASMAERVKRLAEEEKARQAAAPAADAAWSLRPVGARLSDPAPPPPPPPELRGVTLAPPGGMLVAPGEISRPAPVQVDISGLSMAAAGSDVLREDERRSVEAVQVDISGMSMADAGAPLDEIREEKPPVNPDISHLRIVPPRD